MTAVDVEFEFTCCGRCGRHFGVEAHFLRLRRQDHAAFFCPEGHHNFFPARTEVDILREQNATIRQRAERLEAELIKAERAASKASAGKKRPAGKKASR